MSEKNRVTLDANEAVASVAHRASEVIAIYPITPSSSMGELADAWSAKGRPNLWGKVPHVIEMQSEGGAAGAVHGALQAGALATTFTASQGLLLMIPNMYKIAGELTPFAMHVAARTLATHALSIFGDHSDVMACRQTGFALLASGSVQEAQDLAAIAHAATLSSRIPFLHFFDGFRTSHEVAKIEELSDDDLTALLDPEDVAAHRARALTPDRPVLRGTAQNPDTFFQAREASNPFYLACPDIVARTMEKFARLTGRQLPALRLRRPPRGHARARAHGLGGGDGARDRRVASRPAARRSACSRSASSAPSTSRASPRRCRRPSRRSRCSTARRNRVRSASRCTRTSSRRCTRAAARPLPRIVGGRYGLSSKELTPAMLAAVFEELSRETPRNHFTIGITDDVTHTSLPWDDTLDIEPEDTRRAVFYGLGADGTVGANRNSIKILGEETDGYAQGYFVYDSKKSGAMTVSHLRFGPRPIRSAYLIRGAHFVACHQFEFVHRYDIFAHALPGAAVLLNTPHGPSEIWDRLPREAQEQILEKKIRLFVIDAYRIAREAGLKGRINTIMQTCFFAITEPIPLADGDRPDQEGRRGHVRQEGARGAAAQFRRDRRHARRTRAGDRARQRRRRRNAGRPSFPRRRRTSFSGSRPR